VPLIPVSVNRNVEPGDAHGRDATRCDATRYSESTATVLRRIVVILAEQWPFAQLDHAISRRGALTPGVP